MRPFYAKVKDEFEGKGKKRQNKIVLVISSYVSTLAVVDIPAFVAIDKKNELGNYIYTRLEFIKFLPDSASKPTF